MAGVPLECTLMLGYALSLALIALALEWIAGHAHRRSLGQSTAGFTYHPDRDVWRCPRDQHLFPVFSDTGRGRVIYRAPAATCNACPSKAACTDSSDGREIERNTLSELEYGMKRFHRAVSLTLLVLACVILVVELARAGELYPRIALASTLTLFCVIIQQLSAKLSQGSQRSQSSQNADL
jgi:heme A synthase